MTNKAWKPRKPREDILSISFNQDTSCFCVAMSDGFRVFNTHPYGSSICRKFEEKSHHTGTGIGLAEMLFRSNILALVGGGTSKTMPKYPTNKVMIWDDHQRRALGEVAFKTVVKKVRLRKDRIAVALENKVFLYDLEDLRVLHQVDTSPNPEGLMDLSPGAEGAVLACPGLTAGQVRIDMIETRRVKIIDAHNSSLAAIALTTNGRMVATASETGTIVRIFSSSDGTLLKELRRGTDTAHIYSVVFSHGEQPDWLAVTSDKRTVHIFNLKSKDTLNKNLSRGTEGSSNNTQRSLSKLAQVGGAYFYQERSWAQYILPDGNHTIAAFSKEPGILFVVSATGVFHQVVFDTEKKGTAETGLYTLFVEDSECIDSSQVS